MAFRIPTTSKTGSTGFNDQRFYDEKRTCPLCAIEVKGDVCQTCGRKVTFDPIEPRREKDLVDAMSKTRFEFCGISPHQAIEIMSNGDCSSDR